MADAIDVIWGWNDPTEGDRYVFHSKEPPPVRALGTLQEIRPIEAPAAKNEANLVWEAHETQPKPSKATGGK